MLSDDDQISRADPVALEYFRVEQRFRTARTAIKGVCWVAGIYVLSFVVQPLAGQNTALSLAVSLLADAKFAVTITLAGAAGVWAVVERILRHRKTEYLQDRIKKLEAQLDPKRTSSGLTPKGKTNPKDRSR